MRSWYQPASYSVPPSASWYSQSVQPLEPTNGTDRLFPIYVREGRSRKRYNAGYIDCTGQIVIPVQYEDAYPFRNGLAAAKQSGRWGVIDPSGTFVISPTYRRPLVFTEGRAELPTLDEKDGDKRGVISSAGEVIVKPRYRSVSHFSDGLACVCDGQLYGYIDLEGNQVIPPFFEDARAFSEGLAAVKLNGAWGYIYPDASTAVPIRYICERGMAGPFRDGLARVARNGRWGYINKDAKFVVEPNFDMAHEFSEGRAPVFLDHRAGYVSREGEIAVPISFLRAGRFAGGVAAVDTGSGQAHKSISDACETGFIGPNGEWLIPPRFFATGTFQDGLCVTENEKCIEYVNRDGAVVWTGPWVEHLNFDPITFCRPLRNRHYVADLLATFNRKVIEMRFLELIFPPARIATAMALEAFPTQNRDELRADVQVTRKEMTHAEGVVA